MESPREVVNMVCPSLNTRDFRLLSAQETILAGMEKQLLRFEEMGVRINLAIQKMDLCLILLK